MPDIDTACPSQFPFLGLGKYKCLVCLSKPCLTGRKTIRYHSFHLKGYKYFCLGLSNLGLVM